MIAMNPKAPRTVARREFNTPVREPWNDAIREILKAIDNHNQIYFETKNFWHIEKARQLREYVKELKDWIKLNEG
jgi:hypothetical protein